MTITLNGTTENPWEHYGLTHNPFPQLESHKYLAGEGQIALLDSKPLTGPDDIRERLEGFSEEFIELCMSNFKPGYRIKFTIKFPEDK